MRGEIKIENSSLLDFMNMTFENIGRGEINIFGYSVKKILHGWRVIRLGNKSFDIFNALFETSHDDPVVTATFTAVCFNYNSQKTIPVPDSVKNAYQPFTE